MMNPVWRMLSRKQMDMSRPDTYLDGFQHWLFKTHFFRSFIVILITQIMFSVSLRFRFSVRFMILAHCR